MLKVEENALRAYRAQLEEKIEKPMQFLRSAAMGISGGAEGNVVNYANTLTRMLEAAREIGQIDALLAEADS